MSQLILKDKPTKKGPRTYVTTGVGKASYPRLDKPDDKYKADGEYKCGIVVEKKEPWAKQLIKHIDEMHAENIKTQKKLLKKKKVDICNDLPYRDVFEKTTDDDGDEVLVPTSLVEFRFKMDAVVRPKGKKAWTQKPNVFDAKQKPVTAKVGGGSSVRVAGELFPFYNDALGCGLSMRLSAVQVLELVEYGASAETYGFAEEDGFDGSQGGRTSDEFENGEGGPGDDSKDGGSGDDF